MTTQKVLSFPKQDEVCVGLLRLGAKELTPNIDMRYRIFELSKFDTPTYYWVGKQGSLRFAPRFVFKGSKSATDKHRNMLIESGRFK
jgi:hypothetical protein